MYVIDLLVQITSQTNHCGMSDIEAYMTLRWLTLFQSASSFHSIDFLAHTSNSSTNNNFIFVVPVICILYAQVVSPKIVSSAQRLLLYCVE